MILVAFVGKAMILSILTMRLLDEDWTSLKRTLTYSDSESLVFDVALYSVGLTDEIQG